MEPLILFDDLELRPDSGELFRAGSPVKLQPQPARVLEVLATHAGEVVSREEIQRLVWGDSYLDADASLNFCIKQIRRALGDSATQPRYIETIPKRGYRFLKPVRMEEAPRMEASPPEPAPPPQEPVLPRPKPRRRWPPLAGFTAAGVAAVLLVFLIGSRRLHPDTPTQRPAVVEQRPALKPAPAAHQAYLQGKYFFQQKELDKAVDNLQKAVVLDPSFAPAHALLSRALRDNDSKEMPAVSAQTRTLVETEARRALELDPRLPEAHLAMAEALLYYRLDWERAGREYRRALLLDPGLADTHHAYGFYLAALGRHDEAIASIERAHELNPASMLVQSDYAFFFYLAGRYTESIEKARETLDLVPATPEALPQAAMIGRFYSHMAILFSAWKLEDLDMALQSAKLMMTWSNEKTAADQVRSLTDVWEWRERRIRAGVVKVDPLSEARSAVTVGDNGRALEVLERECRTRSGAWTTVLTAVDPALEPLHPDPRFVRVLDCLGLPQDAPARRRLRAGQPAGPGKRP